MEYVYIAIFVIVMVKVITKQSAKPPSVEMPCPSCGYDIRATPERCPECGLLIPRFRRPLDPAKLRDHWPTSPIEPRKPGDDETLVRVWDAPNGFAATLLVEQLRARGIRANTKKQLVPMQVGSYVAPPADFTVNVWSGDVDEAESALAQLASDPFAERIE